MNDDSDSEYEFIDDATPGPGTYPNASTASTIASSIKNEKPNHHFGTSSQRF